jgi:hypothetical protein
VMDQLGHAYQYGPDGNGGPPLLDELRWGAHARQAGRLAAPTPLFPRLETDVETAPDPVTRSAPVDSHCHLEPIGSTRTCCRQWGDSRGRRILVPG